MSLCNFPYIHTRPLTIPPLQVIKDARNFNAAAEEAAAAEAAAED